MHSDSESHWGGVLTPFQGLFGRLNLKLSGLTLNCVPGQYFVVEEDFREFTQMKVDKRFTGMLNMLRHCQRLRELRGGGVTRFMLL